eukprot:UN02395
MRVLVYPQTDCFLLMFSTVSPYSLDNVRSTWIPELRKSVGDNVPIILIGSKIDLRIDPFFISKLAERGMKPVTTQEGERVARETGCVAYMEVCSITGEGVKDVFSKAIESHLIAKKKLQMHKVVHVILCKDKYKNN